ncbi:uncharacterized protein [Anabrus simplex]|uniref:uncharacterized protein n=1 Tax=Anabrus simplex TaxID=316456 RepID=UPI0035A31524
MLNCRTALLLFMVLWPPGRAGDNSTKAAHCSTKTALDECLKNLPAIFSKMDFMGIPSSKKDLDAACSAFKLGMGCMDDFSQTCLSVRDRRLLDDQVAGARHTFKFLCDDPDFQTEYLKYTTCYRGISRDWESCTNRFTQLVQEEMSRKNVTEQSRLFQVCCAKHGFVRCIYVASRLKCRKEEALFLNRIAETLSNIRVYAPLCRDIDTVLCGSSRHWASATASLLVAILVFLVSAVRC